MSGPHASSSLKNHVGKGEGSLVKKEKEGTATQGIRSRSNGGSQSMKDAEREGIKAENTNEGSTQNRREKAKDKEKEDSIGKQQQQQSDEASESERVTGGDTTPRTPWKSSPSFAFSPAAATPLSAEFRHFRNAVQQSPNFSSHLMEEGPPFPVTPIVRIHIYPLYWNFV